MRVLLTGAGGFCGRHLAAHLRGLQVDVVSAGRAAAGPQHHHVDLGDVTAMAGVLRAVRPDYVMHLAGVAQSDHLDDYYLVNTIFAARLLDAMEAAGCATAPTLLIGTAAEYGPVRETDVPLTEDMPAQPIDHYGISKLAQTLMGQAAARRGRPIVVARTFNVVGRGMPARLAIQSFATQIAQGCRHSGRAVVEVGNLDTSRDLVDVDTLANVYWRLIQTPAAYGEVVNVCAGRPVAMRDVLEKLIALAGCPVVVREAPARVRAGDVRLHYGSPVKLHSAIGDVRWRDLDDVLGEMMHDVMVQP